MAEITRSPLCWPDNVARTIPARRRRPQFSEKTLSSAIARLLAEINRLNGRSWDHHDPSVIISTNLRLRQDGLPASGQPEPGDTGVAVYFTLRFSRNGKPVERNTVLTCDKWNRVAWNLYAISKDIEAQRARERWGSTSVEQAFRGYLAIPERCGGPSWWALLEVPSTASEAQIKDAFREKAKTAHPDKGGDSDAWAKLQEAYDQALAGFRA